MERNERSDRWDASERSGLTQFKDCVEKLIPRPLNPSNRNDGEFDFYYFVHIAEGRPTYKSILFCAGGPGQIVQPLERSNTYVDFLFKNGYNVVFFHLRGTGFSQIPPGNDNDKFLRSTFAIDDMEAIRRDFLDKGFGGEKEIPWEAIVGWSFGTVLAQLYAERYKNLVKKLILISPLSRHMFKDSLSAYDDYYKQMLSVYRNTLDQIFTSKREVLKDEFEDLATDAANRGEILDHLFDFDKGILRKTEQAFGSIQSVIDAYSDIEQVAFKRYGLKKYSRQFYQSLRDLRIVGANAIDDTGIVYKQRSIARTLRDELMPRRVPQSDKPGKKNYDQGSQRAYYSFGIQDGLNWVFLRERLERGKSVHNSVNAINGILGTNVNNALINSPLAKVRIDESLELQPWDPGTHFHDVPTLILNGEWDPVTTGGQAERYFQSGLIGPRTLILFPHIGHAISLGSPPKNDQPLLSGAIRVEGIPDIGPGEVLEKTGVATGLELNEQLCIELPKPDELKNTIRIHGCGILQDANVEKSDQGDYLNIIALIENLGERDIHVQDYKWSLRTPLLWGAVDFVKPKTIAARKTHAVFGQLTYGQKNHAKEYRIRPRDKIDPRLRFVGFNLKGGATVELWFQNESKAEDIDPVISQWIIENKDSQFAFRVNVPKLEKQKIVSITIEVEGLDLDATEVLAIDPPEDLADILTACFDAQAENSDRLWFLIWNKDETNAHRIDKVWTISCPAFAAILVLDRVEIEPNTVKRVAGDVRGIKWVKCLDMKPPSGWNSDLRLLSYNILERNSVSMLFKNTGDGSIASASRDWKYVVPTVDPSVAGLDQTLNCLIFSFLVLDPSEFPIPENNEALKLIQDRFKEISLELKICPRPGNVRV